MNNGNSENSRNFPSARSLDPAKSRRHLNQASRDSNQEKSEKSDTSGTVTGSEASELFNFKEVGVFVNKNRQKTKSFGGGYPRKRPNSNKSSVHSNSKHSDESSEKHDARNSSKQDSSDISNKTANEDSNSQNASYHNVLTDLKPQHQQKKSADATSSRNSYDNAGNKPSSLPKSNSNQQPTVKPESSNEFTKPLDSLYNPDIFETAAEKASPAFKEKRIAVPIASKIVNEDVLQRIKSKVSASALPSNTSQNSFANSFLAEFMTAKTKEKRPEAPLNLQQEEESKDFRKQTVVKSPIIMSLNNQEVYADGFELDLSPQTKIRESQKAGLTGKSQATKPMTMEENDPADEMQNDVLKLLYRETKVPPVSHKWEQRSEQKYNYSSQMPSFQLGGSQEFPAQTFGVNFFPSDMHASHGRSHSQFNMQGNQKEGAPLKYISPQTRKMPSKNVVSVLSTETTFDGDFLANHEHLNSGSTTSTHLSTGSKKTSENYQTPTKSGSETKLFDVFNEMCRFYLTLFFIVIRRSLIIKFAHSSTKKPTAQPKVVTSVRNPISEHSQSQA